MIEFSTEEGDILKGNCHLTIGGLLKEILTPRGITVETEYPIRVRVDIVLTNERGEWSEEQKRFLPDGIRDSRAKLIAIEVKCTQSMNEATLYQAEKYDSLLKDQKQGTKKGSSREKRVFYKKEEIQTFLLSAKTPEDKRLRELEFTKEMSPGVLRSTKYKHITLLILNKLPNVLNNAVVKCMCTKRREREGAIALLRNVYNELSMDTRNMINGLSRIGGDDIMLLEATPENLRKWGEEWGEIYLNSLPREKVLKRYSVEERIKGVPVEERIKDVPVEEMLKGISIEELKKFLDKNS